MSQELPQHIYTSTGRMDFETVAVSPKLATDVLRQLEARAASYPSRRAWGDDAPTPPYVVRGFRLAGDEYEYGVGLLLYIGQALNRPEGNYVSHSYAIPREVLQQHDYNLPWIAACLPINFGYYPARGTGADALDPQPFNIDPIEQFRIFRFAVEEMGKAGIHALMKELVERTKDGQTLELEMPPPNPDLGRIFNEVMGAPSEAAPNPDALRLLRLAGAMAVLPAAFKRFAAFTVNDGGSLSGEAGPDAFILRVKRSENPVKPAPPAPWPWLDHCIELATGERFEDLQRMQAWLTKLLPAGCAPSRDTLNRSFDFYHSILCSTGERPSHRTLIHSVGQFHGCDIDVDALYETIEPRLSASGMTCAEHCEFIVKLSGLIAAAGKEIPDKVFNEVKNCLKMEAGRSEGSRKQFLLDLPPGMRAEIWTRTYQKEEPPGRIPWKFSGPHPEHLAFALIAFDPKVIKNGQWRREIVKHLAVSLASRHPSPENFFYGSPPAQLDQLLNLLYALVKGEETINQNLQDELVFVLADSFSRSMPKADIDQQLWRVVRGALAHSSPTGVHQLANFVRQLSGGQEEMVIATLLRLPFAKGTRGQTREFLHVMSWNSASPQLQRLMSAVREMAEVFDRPECFDRDEDVNKVLPEHDAWMTYIRSHNGWGKMVNDFLTQVQKALAHLPIHTHFAAGVTYLYASATMSAGLFEDLLGLLRTNNDEIVAWCVPQQMGWARGRVRLLAMFLILAHNHRLLKPAFELVVNAAKRLNNVTDQEILLERLHGYLFRTKIADWVKQDLQKRLGSPPSPRLQ